MRIVVAGASGFVGRALLRGLRDQFAQAEIVALTRSPIQSNDDKIIWKNCDLFSLLECERALTGADFAYYLVHSMLPSAGLDQGHFADHDLILADNFARAAAKHRLKQVIYLGGLIPRDGHELSPHLQSRLEVEQCFLESSVPLTSLRAGLIIGPRCSSFTIVKRLVRRLPILVCPQWTRTRCQPIDIRDVIDSLIYVLGREEVFDLALDIGGPSILNYQHILRETAEAMGLQRWFFETPIFSARLSRMWVSKVTGAPRDLVYPLVESLKHDMTVNADFWLRIPEKNYASFRDSVEHALLQERNESQRPRAFQGNMQVQKQRNVRSVQRLPLPKGMRAREVAERYARWLPSIFLFIIRASSEGNQILFYLVFKRLVLLELHYSPERSTTGRQLFYIRGGLLARPTLHGRLEFREVLQGQYLMAAVHEFRPVLPWYIYKLTQARAHVWVMRLFGLYLGGLQREKGSEVVD